MTWPNLGICQKSLSEKSCRYEGTNVVSRCSVLFVSDRVVNTQKFRIKYLPYIFIVSAFLQHRRKLQVVQRSFPDLSVLSMSSFLVEEWSLSRKMAIDPVN